MQAPNAGEVGMRIRAILRKRDLTIEDAVRYLDVPRGNLSNAINGYHLPRHALGRALVKLLPGLTLEWLYWGDDRLVPGQLARELAIFIEASRQGLELPVVREEPAEASARAPGAGGDRRRPPGNIPLQ